MKKVLFINHTNDVFGAESILLQAIESCFNGLKQDVYILEPMYKRDSVFRRRVENMGCMNVITLPYKNLGVSLTRSYLVMLYNLYTLILMSIYVKRNRIEIIYSNTSKTCIGVMLARLTRTTHVWHIHEPTDTEHGWTPSLVKLYERLFSYKRNHIVFVSQTQCKQWKKQIAGLYKATVIYNPIKEYSSNITSTEQTMFGYLGSRDKRKNIPMLINAFADVNKKDDNTFLLLSENIGDTNEIIQQQIAKFQLENFVIQKPIIHAIEFYNMIDVLVLPSLSETWGLVVLEAIYAGKATIVTRNTGLSELLQDGIHTLFIDPNDEQSTVNAMIKMTNKKFREQIAQNGRNLIVQQNFNGVFMKEMQSLFS
jgi:glycosyltransferase involved in cell wall biosynthesis